MRRRTSKAFRTTSKPRTRAEPSLGCVSVVNMRKRVDLPAPFGPSSPKIIPRGTLKLRPSTARIAGFPRGAYTLTSFSTSRANSLMNGSLMLSERVRGNI